MPLIKAKLIRRKLQGMPGGVGGMFSAFRPVVPPSGYAECGQHPNPRRAIRTLKGYTTSNPAKDPIAIMPQKRTLPGPLRSRVVSQTISKIPVTGSRPTKVKFRDVTATGNLSRRAVQYSFSEITAVSGAWGKNSPTIRGSR